MVPGAQVSLKLLLTDIQNFPLCDMFMHHAVNRHFVCFDAHLKPSNGSYLYNYSH